MSEWTEWAQKPKTDRYRMANPVLARVIPRHGFDIGAEEEAAMPRISRGILMLEDAIQRIWED